MPISTLDIENYFSILVQYNPDIICRYDINKNIEFINDRITAVTGKPVSYYIGKNIIELSYEDVFMAFIIESFEKCVQECRITRCETMLHVPDQPTKVFLTSFVPILHEFSPSEVVGVFTVSRDITKEKQLELELQKQLEEQKILSQRLIRKANKLQNFSYIVSHNLRSPVSSIVGLMDLYETVEREEEKTEFVTMLKMAVERLSQTVNDLTDAIQINQSIELHIGEIDLHELLIHIQDSHQLLIQQTATKFVIDFTACSKVLYHKIYLESILQNLITNAIKYRSPQRNPIIRLTTKYTDDGVVLICQDNGIGIDLQRHGHKIFGLHKTFHTNQDARGVGLFITKTQVEAMGGAIAVESTPNEGTIFSVLLNYIP